MARSLLAITGMALIVVLATVVTVFNGSESEAAFSWVRPVWYLAIGATLLVALALVGVGRRVDPRPSRSVARALIVWVRRGCLTCLARWAEPGARIYPLVT
jgi:hypothetical protein